MENQKICLECNEPLRGRSDQKFCSDYCRNAFNNKKRAQHKVIIRDIDKILHKNRNILAKLCPGNKVTTVKLALKSEGYDFNYLTNSFETKTGNIYYFCYDYGFRSLDEKDKILIVKKQDYI